MKHGLTVTLVFEASSLNYGEGMGNISVLKHLTRADRQQYTYISRQALRYSMIAYWGLPSFNPVVMTCPTLLKMAAWGGANAIGKGDILGAVEEGRKADVILLNIDQPHLTPTQNLINTVVEAANGHDVTDSVINGKIVMKDREVLTLDEEKIRREAQIHMEEIIKRAY